MLKYANQWDLKIKQIKKVAYGGVKIQPYSTPINNNNNDDEICMD